MLRTASGYGCCCDGCFDLQCIKCFNSEMMIAFGVGKQFRCISLHDIVKALGDRKSLEFYMSSMLLPAVIKPLHSAVAVKVLPGQH